MRENQIWRLSPSVALRPEPFGALAYDFASRRLTFLKTVALVDIVRRLGGATTVGEALDAADIPADQRPAHLSALHRLAETGLILGPPDQPVLAPGRAP
jgi:putative mycofactocin binding protein MftB